MRIVPYIDVFLFIFVGRCWRIDAFELWYWRRLLRVPWTARRSNQSILKEISPGCSLVGLMLKLKLQYFGHLMRRTNSFEKTLMLGKIEGRRRRGQQRIRVGWHHWLNGHEFGWTPGVCDGQGGLACSSSWGHKESDTTEWLNWTELRALLLCHVISLVSPELTNFITEDLYLLTTFIWFSHLLHPEIWYLSLCLWGFLIPYIWSYDICLPLSDLFNLITMPFSTIRVVENGRIASFMTE